MLFSVLYLVWITCYIRSLQRESWHYSLWLSLISFCIGDDETIVFRSKQRSLFHQSIGMLLAVVDLIWQTKPMTEESIQHLEHAIITWRNHQTLNFARFSPSKDQHENFHKLCHAPAHVRRNGGLSTTCTSSYEKSHGIMAKKPAKQHNHRNQEKRMLYVVRRAQLLSQRKLGSGKAYTKAMYRSMRGDDPGFETSSIHSSKSQVRFSFYQLYFNTNMNFRPLRVVALMSLRMVSCSTTMAGQKLYFCLNVRSMYCFNSAGKL